MKILLVCEDDDVASCINFALNACGGCDVITYRYLLKALDNVQEIAPDAVILNAVDYPLHWQLFASYIKCMGIKTLTVLYTNGSNGGAGEAGARDLGVAFTFSSIEDSAALKDAASNILRMARENKEGCAGREDEGRPQDAPCNNTPYMDTPSLIFTHPHSEAFIIGTVMSIDGGLVTFAPDFPSLVSSLHKGDGIEEVSYKSGGKMHFERALIDNIQGDGEVLTIRLGE